MEEISDKTDVDYSLFTNTLREPDWGQKTFIKETRSDWILVSTALRPLPLPRPLSAPCQHQEMTHRIIVSAKDGQIPKDESSALSQQGYS